MPMTPIGLTKHKNDMQNAFRSLVESEDGAIYRAAYNAYYNIAINAFEKSNDVDDPDLQNIVSVEREKCKNAIADTSKKFAEDFCEGMKECLDVIADQIDAHIRSMQINIMTMTPGSTATVLTTAVGPVTGTIEMNNISPTGGITIA